MKSKMNKCVETKSVKITKEARKVEVAEKEARKFEITEKGIVDFLMEQAKLSEVEIETEHISSSSRIHRLKTGQLTVRYKWEFDFGRYGGELKVAYRDATIKNSLYINKKLLDKMEKVVGIIMQQYKDDLLNFMNRQEKDQKQDGESSGPK